MQSRVSERIYNFQVLHLRSINLDRFRGGKKSIMTFQAFRYFKWNSRGELWLWFSMGRDDEEAAVDK